MISIIIKKGEGLIVKHNSKVLKGVDSVTASYDFEKNEPQIIITIKPYQINMEADENYPSIKSIASAESSI